MDKRKNKYPFNRHVDHLLMNNDWCIDEQWGMCMLAEYVSQVEGVTESQSFGKLLLQTFKAQKKAQRTVIISPSFAKGDTKKVVDFQSQNFNDFSGENPVPPGSIAHLKISGVMQMRSSLSTRGMDAFCEDLQACSQNPNIAAAIVEVDSGGGLSLAGQMVRNAIADATVPVVTYAHFIGSAAVHGTLPSDHIMLAGQSSQIGSIGSMVTINKEILAWYKETYDDIYAEVSEDKNKEFRALLKGDKGPITESVTQNAIAFQNAVKSFRELDKTLEESTLKGGMFQADSGIQRGLADSTGTFKDAINLAASLAGLSSSAVPAPVSEPTEVTKTNDNHILPKSNNTNKMEFTAFLTTVIGMLNSAFGFQLADDSSAAQVTEALDKVPEKIGATVNAKVGAALQPLNDQIKELKSQVEANKGGGEKVKDLESKVDGLDTEMQTMKAANKQLIADKKNLETELAEIKGTQDKGGENGDGGDTDPAHTSVEKFNQQYDKLEVKGESKY